MSLKFKKIPENLVYSVVALAYCTILLGMGLPFVSKIIQESKEQDRINLEYSRRELRKYQKASDALFGVNGLADKNHDRALSFEEKVDAYRRMGYTNMFYYDKPFPTPSQSQLESAIRSYSTNKLELD